jgi:hypothetical protein
VYGVWVNDPLPNGVGQNWYITADEFTTSYWKPISVPGVLRENNYVCVVEPPQDFDESVFDKNQISITTDHSPSPITNKQLHLVQYYMKTKSPLCLSSIIGEQLLYEIARIQIQSVLQNDPQMGIAFLKTKPQTLSFTDTQAVIPFISDKITIVSYIDLDNLYLQKFSITAN